MRSIFVIFILSLLYSCAKKPAEEIWEAIDVAQTYLSQEKCSEAIKVLEEVGRQTDDSVYLQVLASAYACRAGYNAIRFIGNDIPTINTASAQLMNSLVLLSSSHETVTDSDSYTDVKTAINILLEANGGSQPSQIARTETFGSRKAGDMGVQALLISIVQLGKFLNYYGNVDASGNKGGLGGNFCFITYTYGDAQAAANSGGGVCDGNSPGHPDLDYTTEAGKRRLCEGLMLITNLIDILDNIDVSSNASLSSLENVAASANQFKTTAISLDPDLSTLLNMTSQSLCETTVDTPAELNNMQLIYASIFESGLQ